jgi:AraC-like DNA-binding protein
MKQPQPTGLQRTIGMVEMLYLSAASPSWRAPAGKFLLAIQRRGRSELRQHGRTAQLGPGDMALCSGADDHRLTMQAASEQLVLLIPAAALLSACPGMGPVTAVRMTHSLQLVALLAIMADSHFHAPHALSPPAAACAAQALIAMVAGCLQALDGPAPAERTSLSQYHLRRIRLYALANLGDTELSVARVGTALGLSAAHIHRLFANETQTFSAWLWDARLHACQQALRQQSLARTSISAIAFQHGFVHATHFSRAFRARFGITASAWRNAVGA